MLPLRRLLSTVAVGALLAVVPVGAATAAPTGTTAYHVDCRAKGASDGSLARPWHSFADVAAHGPFAPGDQLLFRRGTTCTGMLRPAGSGTAGHPIVIGAYGSGARPVLAGKGTKDKTAVLQLANQSYWTVQDLDVTNSTGKRSTTAYRAGVRLINAGAQPMRGLTIQRLVVHEVTSTMRFATADAREWGGIVAVAYGSSNFVGLHIVGNRVDHVGRTGIIVANHTKNRDAHLLIQNNRVSWTRGDGIVVRGSVGARIANNVVANAADEWPCPECGKISPLTANAAIWTAISSGTVIEHNEAYGTRVLGGDGEGFDVDSSATGTVLQYNYAHDNQGGGVLFCGSRNTTARFNIFENNGKSAIAFIGSLPAKDTNIYNNTIYQSHGSGGGAVRYFNGAHGSGIRFFNNVVFNHARGTFRWPAAVWSRSNTYIGLHGPGEPHGAGWSTRDPGLKRPGSGGNGLGTLGGYRPAHPSQLQRGIAITRSVTRDFFGKRIDPGHPPRGAAG